jgi:hypothetical protein
MTGEEMERAIEFLLKSQAAFDTRQAAADARQAAAAERMDRLEAAQAETNQQIRELVAGQQRTQQYLNHLSNVVANIAEITQRNSEEIDVLVKLIGGIIERGNGKPEK